MENFIQEVLHGPPFIRHALYVALCSSLAVGISGTLVVINRISYLAAAISHTALGGIGMSLFAIGVWQWQAIEPWMGALVISIASAIAITWIRAHTHERIDTAIGALWCTGMAIGLLFLHATPGYIEPMHYLFGNILLVGQPQLIMALMLDIILLAVFTIYWRPIYAVSLDESFARARGLSVDTYYALMLSMIALTIVILVYLVGIILVIAMLTLPAAIAGRFTCRLFSQIAMTALVALLIQVAGIFISYALDWPTGATMVVVAALVYACTLAFPQAQRG